MPKMSLEFDGFDQVLAKLKKLDGNVKATTEKALTETHRIVTDKAEKAMSKSFLPAGGRYSTGRTLDSLRREANIEWNGTEASVPVGFDFAESGLVSRFLMYGTPRHGPVGKSKRAKGGHPGTEAVVELYNAFFGSATKNQVLSAQEKIFWDEIRRLEG